MYMCECGREFETRKSLNSHARFCKLYKKVPKKVSKYKIEDDLYRCECGKEFNNFQSLNAHLSHCDYHHDYIGTTKRLHTSELNHSMCWEGKTEEEIKEIKLKAGRTLSQKYKNGELQPSFKGKHHTKEHKQRLREWQNERIKEFGGGANFSEKACEYIDYLNEKNGWNLQHALNGGEITCLGYWLDGYDKDLNIVFEYDEPKHYKDKENNILRDKDIERQNEIIENLHCKFYRYNEYLDLLYEVN